MRRRTVSSAAALAFLVVLSTSVPAAASSARDQYQLSHVDDGAPLTMIPVAQMFTVNANGWMGSVSLYLSVTVDPSVPADQRTTKNNVVVGVYNGGDPGKPDMNVGAELMYAQAMVPAQPGWRTFSFPANFPHSSAIPVSAGQQYAIVVYAEKGWLLDWPGVCGSDVYPGGTAYVIPGFLNSNIQTFGEWRAANPGTDPRACQQDMAFQTFVSATKPTPPPTSTPSSEAPAPRGNALPLMLAGFGLAAAYVTVRRAQDTRSSLR
jgi:hypothetical protein